VDIKRVIAYSTMSQIGYMFLGAGLGAYANGMFHLMTHAFFKALLFMAAGIVIHALAAEQDMRKMGGLRQLLPLTYWGFFVGALSLVGIPPFAGFFSKDSILAAAMDHGAYGYVLWVAGLAGTFLTGLYTFRMLFLVFWGEPSPFVREHFHALRRDVVGISMASTVAVLTVLSVIGGWLQFAPIWHPVETWLQTVAEPVISPTSWQEAVSSALAFVLGLGGIGVAWLIYGARRVEVPRFAFAQRTLERKFYFDALYDALFYAPSAWVARMLGRAVEQPLIAESGRDLGEDTRDVGGLVARAQTGLLRTYALAIASSVAVLAIVFVAVK
jgi:NADH-quinone oxidoreductase subunit L